MFDVYCNFCLENNEFVPATTEFCVQRVDDTEATQYIRCCNRHKGQGEATAELMQHNMAPAVMSSKSLEESIEEETSL